MEKTVLFRPAGSQPSPTTCSSVDGTGKWIACGTVDARVIIVSTKTGKPKRALKGHDGMVSAVSFLGSDKRLLSCSWDGTLKNWQLKPKPKEDSSLKHSAQLKVLATDNDFSKGATGARDGLVKVFSVKSMKCVKNITVHARDVSWLAFTSDGTILITSSWDGECKMWNVRGYEMVASLPTSGGRIRSAVLTPDDSRIYLGMQHGDILSFPIDDPSDKTVLQGHKDIVSSLVMSPDGRQVLSGSWDRTIRLWSVETEKEVDSGRLLTGVTSVSWSPKGKVAYTTDFSGSLVRWNLIEH